MQVQRGVGLWDGAVGNEALRAAMYVAGEACQASGAHHLQGCMALCFGLLSPHYPQIESQIYGTTVVQKKKPEGQALSWSDRKDSTLLRPDKYKMNKNPSSSLGLPEKILILIIW